MIPEEAEWIKELKREPFIPLNKARKIAKFFINEVDNLINYSMSLYPEENEDEKVMELLREFQCAVMEKSIRYELGVMNSGTN